MCVQEQDQRKWPDFIKQTRAYEKLWEVEKGMEESINSQEMEGGGQLRFSHKWQDTVSQARCCKSGREFWKEALQKFKRLQLY